MISIIIPCYNEAKNLKLLVEKFIFFTKKYKFKLILVNNGSTDNSSEILRDLSKKYSFLNIITIQKNIGYGHGIMTGLKAAKTSTLAYTHADLQTPVEDIFKAYEKFQDYDPSKILVKGNRIKRAQEDSTLTKGLAWIVSFILGYKLKDINGQPKVFSKTFLDTFLDAPTDFSFDVYILYKAKVKNLDIHTIDVVFKDRLHGESKWANNIFNKYKTIGKYLISIHKMALLHYNEPNNLYKQLVKFILNGILNVGLFYIFYFIFLNFIFNYIIAALIAFILSFLSSFLINKLWIFRYDDYSYSKSILKYLITNILIITLNLILIFLFSEIFAISYKLAPLISSILCASLSFILCKTWIFKT